MVGPPFTLVVVVVPVEPDVLVSCVVEPVWPDPVPVVPPPVEPEVSVLVPVVEPAVPVVLVPAPAVPVPLPVPVVPPVLPDDPGEASPFGVLSPVSAAAMAGAAATDNPRNAATANSLARFRVFAELLR
ncbi:hypothetical protein C1S82_23925 [Mycolicibacterium cosmeticum]|nr:hypothetical protein C1S82_23925 [Mycolicibacterium cosmeticum]